MNDLLRVLMVEDSPSDAKLIVQELSRMRRPLEHERVETAVAMRAALDRQSWDLVLSDWSMPKFSAPDALAVLKASQLDVPFIIVSGTIGEETAVAGMRAGARDYVLKDNLQRLTPAIERELRERDDRVARKHADAGRLRAEEALHQSEQQLRQSQKMEAVGRLAGGVAHDFNNLLSVIMGYAESLIDDLRPADPMRADLEEIHKAGARAAALTRQLLLFSRQQVAEPRVIDLREVLTSMSDMLQRILGEDVELTTVVTAASPRVKADPSHLEQVILNLVVNARDAMPTGGKLTLELSELSLDEGYAQRHLPTTPGPYVMLAVSDTGGGMDRETQGRIFEPFFTTKEVGKGTGLGLSTVFGIVQQSGGSIWVYSELQQGTTFKIYLPRVEDELETPRSVATPTSLRGTETVLLVEDEEQVRAVVQSILHRQGYEVIAAQNAAEAVRLFERSSGPIDLLLTDVVMPQLSGPELAKRLQALRPELKVLCMSGYTDDSVVRRGVLSSGVAFIQKPITPSSLAKKVREVLDEPARIATPTQPPTSEGAS